MQEPLRITFRDITPSDSVERQIRDRADALQRFFPRITACSIVVTQDSHRARKGRLYRVVVELTVAGRIIMSGTGPHDAHEDCHVAVRDAFDAARRQLEDHARRVRNDVKAHALLQTGRIAAIIAEHDYAFLVTDDGEEIYVHRNSVPHGGFERLRVGGRVRYVLSPEPGEHGPQASTVEPISG